MEEIKFKDIVSIPREIRHNAEKVILEIQDKDDNITRFEIPNWVVK